nr:TdcA1-ORF1-ORF2 protein [Ipomoea batatas]
MYETGLRQYNPGVTDEDIDNEVEKNFASWFRDYVYNPGNNICNQSLIDLACSPLLQATTYNGYVANGFKFQTEEQCVRKSTNNFGVSIKGISLSHDESFFFGTLKEVVEIEYPNIPLKRVVLFNCEWFDPTPNIGTKLDFDSGLVEVYCRRRYRKYDPFIIVQNACQSSRPQRNLLLQTELKTADTNRHVLPPFATVVEPPSPRASLSLIYCFVVCHKGRTTDILYWSLKDVANDLRQSQPDASNAQLWLEAIGGVKRGGFKGIKF